MDGMTLVDEQIKSLVVAACFILVDLFLEVGGFHFDFNEDLMVGRSVHYNNL